MRRQQANSSSNMASKGDAEHPRHRHYISQRRINSVGGTNSRHIISGIHSCSALSNNNSHMSIANKTADQRHKLKRQLSTQRHRRECINISRRNEDEEHNTPSKLRTILYVFTYLHTSCQRSISMARTFGLLLL